MRGCVSGGAGGICRQFGCSSGAAQAARQAAGMHSLCPAAPEGIAQAAEGKPPLHKHPTSHPAHNPQHPAHSLASHGAQVGLPVADVDTVAVQGRDNLTQHNLGKGIQLREHTGVQGWERQIEERQRTWHRRSGVSHTAGSSGSVRQCGHGANTVPAKHRKMDVPWCTHQSAAGATAATRSIG